ncbi:MAG: hypothetical protein P5702_20675 [Limnospira sp. PMC 1291.21]|uniref:Uncharacterized protein n=1 Tax=Limnospira fusiformis PMC 851.14 TaxID=2219512 RepID=A0ABU9ET94_LIMFS|nr:MULTISPECIES: hypothetical protein [Limnospira]MDC0836962.1 hypothetical protein [Limnoraphis robusta]MDY7051355.1 hypothetical protein [Limnospira fusiformis LS22]MDT9180073.1 hypothetical protein [Limnospira sp. PMC 1238.20]MDT9190019.1 hypothetical protein [Limnospira sp. PMC 894.15]MDT9195342.1 hypothetical protein [Limnospira sp. PMC 1245.20]
MADLAPAPTSTDPFPTAVFGEVVRSHFTEFHRISTSNNAPNVM